jgi:serine/threonine protein phosphatase PrpC
LRSSARVIFHGETNVGMKRNHNEDNFALLEDEKLFIVADGMGGHASGEVASKLAIDTLRDFFRATSADPDATWPYKMDKSRGYEENRLITGVKLANLRIHEHQQKELKLKGMGTTIVTMYVTDDGVFVGHVGDSRAYRVRDGKLDMLTEDHSLLNDYIKMKRLTEEEIANFPHKNVIVRALGMKEHVKVDTVLDPPKPGDIYLLCSDGLSGPVTDEEILEIVMSSTDISVTCNKLIDRANENGGPDNVTAVLCKWIGSG